MTTSIQMIGKDNLKPTSTTGGTFTESFRGKVMSAKAFTTGFHLVHKHDRHIREIAAMVTNVTHSMESVTVSYIFLMKDDTNKTEDNATGEMGVVILAEIEGG